ncbi:MAG: hypothetical protein QG626_257 [Patescibacteria group bacterium]|nr:hypothetical protein [Patescibacteria group bacterium]
MPANPIIDPISKSLKLLGFKKIGLRRVRDTGEVMQLIILQKSNFSDRYSLNVGVRLNHVLMKSINILITG